MLTSSMKPYSSSHPTLSDPKILGYPITPQLYPFQRGCLVIVLTCFPHPFLHTPAATDSSV